MADDAPVPALELTLPINPPVVAYGQTFDRITLREPTAADMAEADQAAAGYALRIALVAAASDVPGPAVVEQFGVSLLNTCTDYLFAWIGVRRAPLAIDVEATRLSLPH